MYNIMASCDATMLYIYSIVVSCDATMQYMYNIGYHVTPQCYTYIALWHHKIPQYHNAIYAYDVCTAEQSGSEKHIKLIFTIILLCKCTAILLDHNRA